jgi:hypothetical protein
MLGKLFRKKKPGPAANVRAMTALMTDLALVEASDLAARVQQYAVRNRQGLADDINWIEKWTADFLSVNRVLIDAARGRLQGGGK